MPRVLTGSDTIDVLVPGAPDRSIVVWECVLTSHGISLIAYDPIRVDDEFIYRHRQSAACEPRLYRVTRCRPTGPRMWHLVGELLRSLPTPDYSRAACV